MRAFHRHRRVGDSRRCGGSVELGVSAKRVWGGDVFSKRVCVCVTLCSKEVP